LPASQPFQPDGIYCAYCHAPAAGACASCRAVVCVDCAELVTGSGKSFAVCRDCRGKTSMARAWTSLLWPILAGVAVLGAIVWLLRG
jgi:hypothetical protein